MPRTVGVEEEMFLVDPDSAALRPASARLKRRDQLNPWLQQELFLQQLEIASPPCSSMDSLFDEVRDGRLRAISSARAEGVEVAVLGSPPLTGTGILTPNSRYQRLRDHFGAVARDNLICGLHVHVEVTDADEAVAAVDRIQPWLPILLALSANSPYWHGEDTCYASFRSQVAGRWPTSGPTEPFLSAAGYAEATAALRGTTAALDPASVYFDARPSARYPTVEVRVTDTCTDIADTILIAALTRALIDTEIDAWRQGEPVPHWRTDLLRAASWVAARWGLSKHLLDPITRELVPAAVAVASLRTHVSDALAANGDGELARSGTQAILGHGNGSVRQRAAFARTGTFAGVVVDAIRRSSSEPHSLVAAPLR